MSATVRVSCPHCTHIDHSLLVGAVTVTICRGGATTYGFVCPRSGGVVVESACQWTVDVLQAAGARVVVFDRPAELSETHTGPPISHDDLVRFHELLGGIGGAA